MCLCGAAAAQGAAQRAAGPDPAALNRAMHHPAADIAAPAPQAGGEPLEAPPSATQRQREAELARAEELIQRIGGLLAGDDPQSALAPARQAAEIRRRLLGSKALLYAYAEHWLAEVERRCGNAAEAEAAFRRACAAYLASAGRNSEDYADCTHSLAMHLYRHERYVDACAEFRAAYEVYTQVLGADAERTQMAAVNLAEIYLSGIDQALHASNLETAGTLAAQALAMTADRWGPGHWRVVSVRVRLHHVEKVKSLPEPQRKELLEATQALQRAAQHGAADELTEALALARGADEVFLRLLGQRDHLRLSAQFRIGSWLLRQREREKAAPHLLAALELSRDLYGMQHPQTAQCLNQLGRLHFSLGIYHHFDENNEHFAHAADYFRTAARIHGQTRGADHADSRAMRANLADALEELLGRLIDAADPAAAPRAAQELLALRRDDLEPGHWQTLDAEHWLEAAQWAAALPEQRRAALRRAVAAYRRARDRIESYQTWQRLGPLLARMRGTDPAEDTTASERLQAARIIEQAVASLYEAVGRPADGAPPGSVDDQVPTAVHRLLGEYLLRLGWVQRESGQAAQAVATLETACAYVHACCPLKHPARGDAAYELARALRAAGDDSQAVRHARTARLIHAATLGAEHDRTHNSTYLLREVLDALAAEGLSHDDFAAAREALEELIRLLSVQYGEDDYRVADARVRLQTVALVEKLTATQRQALNVAREQYAAALARFDQGHDVQAAEAARQALPALQRLLGPAHPETAAAQHLLGRMLYFLGQYDDAAPLLVEAVATRRRRLGQRHPLVAVSLHTLALVRMEQGALAEAAEHIRAALAIDAQVFGSQSSEYRDGLQNLADVLDRALRTALAGGDLPAARTAAAQLLDVLTEDWGASNWRTAVARGQRDYVEFLGQCEPALRAALQAADAAAAQAEALYQQGRYAPALPLARQAAETRHNVLGPDHLHTAAVQVLQAEILLGLGEYEVAEPLLRQALATRSQKLGAAHPYCAAVINDLGHVDVMLVRFRSAEDRFLQAERIYNDAYLWSSPEIAQCKNNLAAVYLSTERFDEAEPLLLDAERILRTRGAASTGDYTLVLSNLGVVYWHLGNYEKAADFLQRALDVRTRLSGADHAERALLLSNLATIHLEQARYAQAEPLLVEALGVCRRSLNPWHPYYFQALHNLAGLYLIQDKLQRAEELLLEAQQQVTKLLPKKHPYSLATLNNLALLRVRRGDVRGAEALLREQLALAGDAPGDVPGAAALYHRAGLALLATIVAADDRAQAAALARELMVREQQTRQRVFGMVAESGMHAYRARRGIVSLDVLLLALGIHDGTASDDGAREVLAWLLRQKADVFHSRIQQLAAAHLVEQDDPLARKLAQLHALQQQLSNAPLQRDRQGEALREHIGALQRQVDELQAQLARQLSDRLPTPQAAADDPQALLEAIAARLPDGSVLVEVIRAAPVTLEALRGAAAQHVPHYYAFVLHARSTTPRVVDLGPADALDEEVQRLHEALASAQHDFRRLAAEEAAAQELQLAQALHEASRDLYARLFGRLRPALGNCTRVFFAADGQLLRVPLEILVDEEAPRLAGGQPGDQAGGALRYLIERYEFVYLTSGRDLLRQNAPAGTGTFVFAGPDFDLGAAGRHHAADELLAALPPAQVAWGNGLAARGGRSLRRWDPLEGAAAEAQIVQHALSESPLGPVTAYQGPQALEDVLKRIRRPRVLHLATHGFYLAPRQFHEDDWHSMFSADPGAGRFAAFERLWAVGNDNPLLRSGLVLAGANRLGEAAESTDSLDDGWLTAMEVAVLDLRGTELVVLSACESGLGDIHYGDGIDGLRRAFLYAGARTLVISLFPVPDSATRDLMTEFYAGVRGGGSKLAALRNAQLKMIQQRRARTGAAHPWFWGGFVLLGDPQ